MKNRHLIYGLLLALLLVGWSLALPPNPTAAALNPAPPDVITGVAFVGGTTVDLTWDPASDYPEGEFLRLVLYRDGAPIATLTNPTTWFYRDSGLAMDTSYRYSARVFYYPVSDPDNESYSQIFSRSTTTGRLSGSLYTSLSLPAGRYAGGPYSVRVLQGATLTLNPGTTFYGSDFSIRAENSYLYINGVTFEAGVNLTFGSYTSAWGPETWGEGWVKNTEVNGDITVYSRGSVQIDTVTHATIEAGKATGQVDVAATSGDSAAVGGHGAVIHNTLGAIRAYGSVAVRDNVVSTLRLADTTTARFNEITSTVYLDGGAILDSNVVGEVDNLEGTTIEIGEDAAGVQIRNNQIINGQILAYNEDACGDPLPATAYLADNTMTDPAHWQTFDYALDVQGGAHVTLERNTIEGDIRVHQDCTQFSARHNVITGSISTCWTPVLDITDNILNGRLYLGSAVALTCSGDAVGTIARNTIQNIEPYQALYIGQRWYTESHADLAIRHNCLRLNHTQIGATLYTSKDHGPVDLRYNWWGDASGPNHPDNPGGLGGRIVNDDWEPVVFSPWDTAPTTCREQIVVTRQVDNIRIEMVDEVPADGTTEVTLSLTVLDQYGVPYPNVPIGLSLIPDDLGTLSPKATTADDQGRAIATYTPPDLIALGDRQAVEIKAVSGSVEVRATLPFAPPETDHVAEPRYHATLWPAHHALLPPDPALEAKVEAVLTYDGEPVRHYTVTLTLETLDGVYDGAFTGGSDVLGSVSDHELTLLTDDAGKVWATYRTDAQASRSRHLSVRDGVKLSSDAFPHLASWTIETGMDLELVEIRRPGAVTNDYVVLGQPEPLEIVVRDALHPSADLSTYHNSPDPILDPDTDPLLGVRLDVSHPARDNELFDLMNLVHLQVPRMTSFDAYLQPGADGQVYLRTSAPNAIEGRPVIIPYLERYNIYWLRVGFQRQDGKVAVAETYAGEQGDNNVRLIGFVANENLSTLETFFKDNPCAAGNTHFGRQFKCALGILSWYPGLVGKTFDLASTALSLCETIFNVLNGDWMGAGTGAGNYAGAELDAYLSLHPDVVPPGLTPDLISQFQMVGNVAKVLDCYWAVNYAPNSSTVRACALAPGVDAAAGPHNAELASWIQGLLMSGQQNVDALAVIGPHAVTVTTGDGTPILSATGVMTMTETAGGTALSLVDDAGSFYLLPRGDYALEFTTDADTEIRLYHQAATMTQAGEIRWVDAGTQARRGTLTFDATGASALQIDAGSDGSVERTIPADAYPYLPAPAGLRLSKAERSNLDVTWTPVSGATGYRVYYGTESRLSPAFEGYPEYNAVTATSHTLTGLPVGDKAIYVSVTAVQGATESPYSGEGSIPEATRPTPVYLPLVLK
jgi:hypothetical protein